MKIEGINISSIFIYIYTYICIYIYESWKMGNHPYVADFPTSSHQYRWLSQRHVWHLGSDPTKVEKLRPPTRRVQQNHPKTLYLLGGWFTPLKNMSSSIGIMSNPTYGKIKLMATKPPTSYFKFYHFLSCSIQISCSSICKNHEVLPSQVAKHRRSTQLP